LGACARETPDEFRVGLIGVHEGPMAGSSGIPGRRGAELAVAQLNAEGGVLIAGRRHRVVLYERETENRPDAAALAARALINLDSIDVLVGPQTSTLAIAAAPVAEVSEIPMIAPMASNPAVTAGRRMVVRLAFVDAFQGDVLARFAYDSLGVRRAAALHDAGSPYGRDITRLFRETFEARGGEIVHTETFDADDPRDHAPQLRRILEERPDAILLPSFVVHDSAQIRLARELGFRGRFLGSDAWDVRTLARRQDAAGSIVVANWDRSTDSPAARAFLAAWNAAYPDELPRATAAATYDAVLIAAEAASRAGVRSGGAVADSIRHLGRWSGALTAFDFRGTGDPVRGAVILEVFRDSMPVRALITPES
jgi:branched-chain amino acid transport system substrate-binding protein